MWGKNLQYEVFNFLSSRDTYLYYITCNISIPIPRYRYKSPYGLQVKIRNISIIENDNNVEPIFKYVY